jgi:hypothetical protein
MIGVDLAAIDEFFGYRLVKAEVDEDHELNGILYRLFLSDAMVTSSSIAKFLIMR